MPLGTPPIRRGKQWQGRVTEVPIELLQALKLRPLPVTIGGASQRTFTLNGSVTQPAVIWNGDDFIYLKQTVAYSWVVGTNNTLSSAGAETDLTNGTVGVWYMYIDEDGQNLVPSLTAPSYVETSLNTGVLGHPGTSRAQNWTYVGFMIANATTPVFEVAEKRGFTWFMDRSSTDFATICSWRVNDEFNVFIPDMGIHGLTVGGYIRVALDTAGSCFNTITISGNSSSCFGVVRAVGGVISATGKFSETAFSGLVPAASGLLYQTMAGGAVFGEVPGVCITSIVDVV